MADLIEDGSSTPGITSHVDAPAIASIKASPPAKLTDIKDWNRWSKQFIMYAKSVGLYRYLDKPPIAPSECSSVAQLDGFDELLPEMQEKLLQLYDKLPTPAPKSAKLDPQDYALQTKLWTAISDHFFSVVQHCQSSSEIWTTLEAYCIGNSTMEKRALELQFRNFKLLATESVQTFCRRFRDLLSDMNTMGILPTDFAQNERLLDALPMQTYGNFVNFQRYNMSSLNTQQLLNALRNESMRISNWTKPHSHRSGMGAAHSTIRARGRGRGRGSARRGPRQANVDYSTAVCHRCWEDGHITWHCPNEIRPVPAKHADKADRAHINRYKARATSQSNRSVTFAAPESTKKSHSFSCPSIAASVLVACEANHPDCQPMGIDTCSTYMLLNDSSLFTSISDVDEIVTGTADHGEIRSNRESRRLTHDPPLPDGLSGLSS